MKAAHPGGAAQHKGADTRLHQPRAVRARSRLPLPPVPFQFYFPFNAHTSASRASRDGRAAQPRSGAFTCGEKPGGQRLFAPKRRQLRIPRRGSREPQVGAPRHTGGCVTLHPPRGENAPPPKQPPPGRATPMDGAALPRDGHRNAGTEGREGERGIPHLRNRSWSRRMGPGRPPRPGAGRGVGTGGCGRLLKRRGPESGPSLACGPPRRGATAKAVRRRGARAGRPAGRFNRSPSSPQPARPAPRPAPGARPAPSAEPG